MRAFAELADRVLEAIHEGTPLLLSIVTAYLLAHIAAAFLRESM